MGKLFLEFFGFIGCCLGFLGGVLLALLSGDYWPIALGVAVLAFTAYPRAKGWLLDLIAARKAARLESSKNAGNE